MYKLVFLFLLPFFMFAAPESVVTYEKGGRFGDNLLCYLHAKWISYKYELPVRYKPFRHSSDLVLHDKEVRLSKDPMKNKRILARMEDQPIDVKNPCPMLYVCPYFPEARHELEENHYWHFQVDWKDPKFRKTVWKMIAPKKSLHLIVPPKQCVNIAIHVRDGGGYDPGHINFFAPLKVPPISFYAEAIAKIVPLFKDKEIFCQIFTDAVHPQKIVAELEKAVPQGSSVKFAFRKSGKNNHKKNVLEDFFSFFNFDVLIRPESNFSIVPSLIHDFAIVYSPIKASRMGDIMHVDEAHLEINDPLYQKLLEKKTHSSDFLSQFFGFLKKGGS